MRSQQCAQCEVSTVEAFEESVTLRSVCNGIVNCEQSVTLSHCEQSVTLSHCKQSVTVRSVKCQLNFDGRRMTGEECGWVPPVSPLIIIVILVMLTMIVMSIIIGIVVIITSMIIIIGWR